MSPQVRKHIFLIGVYQVIVQHCPMSGTNQTTALLKPPIRISRNLLESTTTQVSTRTAEYVGIQLGFPHTRTHKSERAIH